MTESDRDRFERWMRAFGAAVVRAAASYEWKPELREELVQEMGLAIWRALPQFRGESSERSFVLRIAHNRGISHASKAMREPRTEALDEAMPSFQQGPEGQAQRNQRFDHLSRALLRLNLLDRELVTLSLEGLEYEEIAEITGLRANHVGVRLHRAKNSLKRMLSEME